MPTGRDVRTGGAEAHVFTFYIPTESMPDASCDAITDFETALDVINLAAMVPGGMDRRRMAAFTASGVAERYLQETASGSTIVQLDADGDGAQECKTGVNLSLMQLIDRQFLQTPFHGAHQTWDLFDGLPSGARIAWNLMSSLAQGDRLHRYHRLRTVARVAKSAILAGLGNDMRLS